MYQKKVTSSPRLVAFTICSTVAPPPSIVRLWIGHRLPFRGAREAVMFPCLGRSDRIEVRPEVGGDRVVGEVGHHARLPAVLDLPERVAAELAVVALLIDAEAARAVDEHAVLH